MTTCRNFSPMQKLLLVYYGMAVSCKLYGTIPGSFDVTKVIYLPSNIFFALIRNRIIVKHIQRIGET